MRNNLIFTNFAFNIETILHEVKIVLLITEVF
jgi:hypothetical protein